MNQRNKGLDLIRAVAIACVLACHFVGNYTNGRRALIFPLGALGVELFFVLSGFLIGGILIGELNSDGALTPGAIGHFWFRRWARTLPNYVLFLCVAALLWHCPSPWRFLTFTENLWGRRPEFFTVAWSLAVEEWFYFLLPLLALALTALFHNGRRGLRASVIFMLAAPMILRIAVAPGRLWDSQVRCVVALRLDAVMYGVALALLSRHSPRQFLGLARSQVAVVGALLTLAAYVWVTLRYASNASGDFIATRADCFIFCAFDAGCALMLPWITTVKNMPRTIGITTYYASIWSYSAYLCHPAVLWTLDKVAGRPRSHLQAIIWMLLALALTMLVSALVYQFFERQILRLRDAVSESGTRRASPKSTLTSLPAHPHEPFSRESYDAAPHAIEPSLLRS